MRGDFAPGDWVTHPTEPDWGTGQVQSVDRHRVTVNFPHAGKRTINTDIVSLQSEHPAAPRADDDI